MKHYLNKRLKGKTGPKGEKLYSVYLEFSAKGQTYQIKSRLLKMMLSEKKFSAIVPKEGRDENILLARDKEILELSIKEASENGSFDYQELKNKYQNYTITFLEWLHTFISLSIDRVENGELESDEGIWSLASEIGSEEYNPVAMNVLELQAEEDVILTEPLLYLQKFVMQKRGKGDLLGLAILYDWYHGEFQEEFTGFLQKTDLSEKKKKTYMAFLKKAANLAFSKNG